MIETARRRRVLEHHRAPIPNSHPSPELPRTPRRRRVRWHASASAEIGLGLLHFGREQRALAQPRAADAVRQE